VGMKPRWIREGAVYAQTQRTVDRMFLFKPDPVIKNIIGASAARAMRRHPVKLFWLDFNINHEQNGIGPIDGTQERLTDVALFKQTFHRIAAEEINRHLEREGPLFSTPSRNVECVDNESVHQQFEYALTNPAKDGLVDRIDHWGGFSSYPYIAKGKDPVFTYIDRTAWHKAGGKRCKKPIESFTVRIRLEFTPLPGTEHMSPDQRQAMIRRRCREVENEHRNKRDRPVMTKAKMDKLDHRDRPQTKPLRTPKPLCHAASEAAEKQYRESYKRFLDSYIIASAAYRNGAYDTDFPSGSFKPPLIAAA